MKAMPITTVDIPEHLLKFIDDLVHRKVARNRKEIIVRALEIYVKFQVHKWRRSLIFVNDIRKGLLSKGSLEGLTFGMSENELYEAGKRMGWTLRDSANQRRLDISLPKNHEAALGMLEDFGWGDFETEDNRITVTDCLFPAPLIQGYLETALAIRLRRIESAEDILFFAKETELAPVNHPRPRAK